MVAEYSLLAPVHPQAAPPEPAIPHGPIDAATPTPSVAPAQAGAHRAAGIRRDQMLPLAHAVGCPYPPSRAQALHRHDGLGGSAEYDC